jgi:hypothetical protein
MSIKKHMKKLILFIFCIMATCSFADTTKEMAVAELQKAFSSCHGYSATYESTGKDKHLKTTVIVDEAGKMGLLQTLATKLDITHELLMWTNEVGNLYASMPGEGVTAVEGINDFLTTLEELIKSLTFLDPILANSPQLSATMWLEKDTIGGALAYTKKNSWPYNALIADAKSITKKDDDYIFVSEEYGNLTFSGKHGMLLKQSIKGIDGEERVLTLSKIKLSATAEDVKNVSAKWQTKGAKKMPYPKNLFADLAQVFQATIQHVENGKTGAKSVAEIFDKQHELLCRVVKPFVITTPNSVFSDDYWDTLVNREKLGKLWQNFVPSADLADEKAFTAYFANPTTRIQLANTIASLTSKDEALQKIVMKELLTANKQALLSSKTEAGAEAKAIIVRSLTKAYCAEIVKLKIESNLQKK